MYKALHSRNDVHRLYVSRKEGRRVPASIQDSIDAPIQQLEDYIKKCRGRPITATRSNIDNTSINRTKITRKQKQREKQYGHFKQ